MHIPPAIDFRYDFEIAKTFGANTEEYDLLSQLVDDAWEDYFEELACCGVEIGYDLVEDEYYVNGHQAENPVGPGANNKN